MPIHLIIQDADVVIRELNNVIRRIEDPKKPLEAIRKDFFDVEKRWFDSEGRGSWAPLSPKTLRSKGTQGSILVRSGQLRASLTQSGARYGFNRINRATLFVGTTHPAAAYHEGGTRYMPRRSIIGIQDSDVKRWSEFLLAFAVDNKDS